MKARIAMSRRSSFYLRCAAYVLAAAGASAQPLLAADAADAVNIGRVLVAAGDTVAIRGSQTIQLKLDSMIQNGDALRTGQSSNLQVRFIDDSVVSLKESSELRIENFKFTGKADGSERAHFTLVKGGLRTITGAIGGKNNKNYRMATNTATLGVRGTDYTVTLCQMDCSNGDGTPAKDGLYGRVLGLSHGSNRIVVTGGRDSKEFGINENFYVADNQSPVLRLVAPAEIVPNRLNGRSRPAQKEASQDTPSEIAEVSVSAGNEAAVTGGIAADSRTNSSVEPVTKVEYVATQNLGEEGRSVVALPPRVVVFALDVGSDGAVVDDNSAIISGNATTISGNAATISGNTATINANSQVTAITDSTTCAACAITVTVQNTSSTVDAGSVKLNGGSYMYWGRWIDGSVTKQVAGTSTVYTPAAGVPFVIGESARRLPDKGSFLYTLAGGPSVVDASGNVGGKITQGAFRVGFGATQTISVVTPLNFTVGGANYTLTSACGGACTFNVPTTSMSLSLSGICTGGDCATSSAATSSATGLLVGDKARGLGLVGTVSSPAPTVTFAGAFER